MRICYFLCIWISAKRVETRFENADPTYVVDYGKPMWEIGKAYRFILTLFSRNSFNPV